MKNSVLLLLLINFLVGCSSTSDELFNNEGKPTMLEMHEKHKQGFYGNRIEEARKQFNIIDNYKEQKRVTFNDDLRLPNPELEFVVFPKRNPDGSVSPQTVKRFSMYRQVHYQTGGY